MERHKCHDKSEKLNKLEAKKLSVCKGYIKDFKAKNADLKNVDIECSTTNCADINTLDVKKIYLDGQDITCSFTTPAVSSFTNTFVDIGATGPIGVTGPATVDPVVFNALVANAFENRKALQCRIYDGRCAIYEYLKANGCPQSCPPAATGPTGGSTGCYTYFTGSINNNLLTVINPVNFTGLEKGQVLYGPGVLPNTVIQGPTGPTGTYLLNNSQTVGVEPMYAVNPSSDGCTLAPVGLKVFGAMTLPLYQVINCGPTGPTGPTGPNCSCIGLTGPTGSSYESITTSVNFNLQCTYLLEVAKSTDARVVSVLVQVGSYDSVTASVVIDEVFIANKQLYPTLDVLYGENFANTISIPNNILTYAISNSSNPNKQGAIQVVVYEEDGICIWNPVGNGFECRGGPPPEDKNSQGGSSTQTNPARGGLYKK